MGGMRAICRAKLLAWSFRKNRGVWGEGVARVIKHQDGMLSHLLVETVTILQHKCGVYTPRKACQSGVHQYQLQEDHTL